jgi:nucleotide-binding universal stress UspA family protein
LGQDSFADRKAISVNRILLATDGSKYADAAAQLLLDLPIPRSIEVIIVTVLQSHLDTLMKTPTLDLHTNQELFASLQEAEEEEARKIVARSTEQFKAKGHKTTALIMRGGAGESILKAAEEYVPDMIAIGSKGLTGIESLFLGSVAERVARYANCSVLIGRTHT